MYFQNQDSFVKKIPNGSRDGLTSARFESLLLGVGFEVSLLVLGRITGWAGYNMQSFLLDTGTSIASIVAVRIGF